MWTKFAVLILIVIALVIGGSAQPSSGQTSAAQTTAPAKEIDIPYERSCWITASR